MKIEWSPEAAADPTYRKELDEWASDTGSWPAVKCLSIRCCYSTQVSVRDSGGKQKVSRRSLIMIGQLAPP